MPLARTEIPNGAGGRNRTVTGCKPHGILSPARLPVSPLRLKCEQGQIIIPVGSLLCALSLLLLFSVSCVRWSPPRVGPSPAGPCRSAVVTWLAPEDVKERGRLDSWCAGVGDAALHNVHADAPPPANIDEVTFVSWNVHVGNGDVRAFVRDLTGGTFTGGRPVSHYVLLLQEAVRTEGVPPLRAGASGASRIRSRPAGEADIVRTSHELGLSLVYVPLMRNGRSAGDPAEDRGSAILSTLPVSDPIAVELPGERERRVVVFARIGSFHAGVIHLDVRGGAARLGVFWTPWLRDVQVRSLNGHIPAGPLVIGADLNTWHGRDEPAVRYLNDAFGATRLSVDRHGLGLRVLDYMFFRSSNGRSARYRQIANKYGSDHRPLVGWVE